MGEHDTIENTATKIESIVQTTPDVEVPDSNIMLVQKLVELQNEDDISTGQLEQLALQNDKLKRMIEDKKQLLNIEAKVKKEEEISASRQSRQSNRSKEIHDQP